MTNGKKYELYMNGTGIKYIRDEMVHIVESFIICKYVIISIINCPTKDLYKLLDTVNASDNQI